MIVSRYRVSFWGDGNVLEFDRGWHKPYTLPSELHELITPTTCSSAPKTCSFQNAPPNNKTIAENKTYNLVIKLMTLQNRLCAYKTQSLMER